MLQNQLQKAFELAKKTGDRLILFDSAKSDNACVVMNLDEYENLILGRSEVRNLTENELLDKINRDIAIWKSENNYNDFDRNFENNKENNAEITKEDFEDYLDEEDDEEIDLNNDFIDDFYKNDFASPGLKSIKSIKESPLVGNRNNWSIPKERKKTAEDIIEEDRQYLEEVPF